MLFVSVAGCIPKCPTSLTALSSDPPTWCIARNQYVSSDYTLGDVEEATTRGYFDFYPE